MFILGLVFIVMSFIVIGQFVIMPVILFVLHIHDSIQETYRIDNKEGNKSSYGTAPTQESADRSLKLLKSQLNRLAGSHRLYFKRGKLIVELRYSTDVNINAAKRHLRMRGITNYKVK